MKIVQKEILSYLQQPIAIAIAFVVLPICTTSAQEKEMVFTDEVLSAVMLSLTLNTEALNGEQDIGGLIDKVDEFTDQQMFLALLIKDKKTALPASSLEFYAIAIKDTDDVHAQYYAHHGWTPTTWKAIAWICDSDEIHLMLADESPMAIGGDSREFKVQLRYDKEESITTTARRPTINKYLMLDNAHIRLDEAIDSDRLIAKVGDFGQTIYFNLKDIRSDLKVFREKCTVRHKETAKVMSSEEKTADRVQE